MPIHKYMIEHVLFPAMERYKDNRIRALLSELQQSQYADIASIQTQRLTRLLLHCKEHVPAYRAILPAASQIRADPFRVLRTAVPPLPKRAFQRDAARYLADNIADAQRIPNCTGGSTGEPIHFFMTRQQVETYEAARWRGLGWYGITPGSRSMMLWGNPIELSRQAQLTSRLREQLLKNRRILSAYQLSDRNLVKYVKLIERYQPEYLYGYATILTAFARMIEQHKIPLHCRLKAVVSTSETLSDRQSALLERVFHCPVANEYGARDAGILAYRCPQGSMHITAENCVIEVLDPISHKPLPNGESGVLAVTDLNNFVQPRLRYLLGDIGTLSATACPCGRHLPLLSRIDGREDDLLVGRAGALVHGNVIGQLLRPLSGLSAFQFRQHTPQQATLFLVKAAPDVRPDEAGIIHNIAKVLPDTSVSIQYVEQIPRSPSGKKRYAIRAFDLTSD